MKLETAANAAPHAAEHPLVDYYAVLGVNPDAEDIVIRAAYKALAQRYHPDRFEGETEEAHRRMSELTEAYEVLADPVRRPKYDRRRTIYARAVAARVKYERRFATALPPPERRANRRVRSRYRVGVAALMGALVVLTIFNVFHHSAEVNGSMGFSGTNAARPVGETRAIVESLATSDEAAPSVSDVSGADVPTDALPAVKESKRAPTKNVANVRPASSGRVPTTATPCDEVAEVLGLCTRTRPVRSE